MKQHKQLTLKERYQIEALLENKLTARAIALKLNRSNKTIFTEMSRCDKGRYHAEQAHHDALNKRHNATKFTKINK
ncbi:helix-turn-helix domain-containing protein [uncultured Shewanella sp.]|uniref:helix-turn-helix domain-containing protein n=1 Tax=uncultured Shewanella sp. TaxID=173975 RepID=UPI00260B7AEA|nr:helix-turn-helix domain-containing protein [uncultured Shewanella sp.]